MSSFLGPWLAAICLLSLNGCGSSSTANVVTVLLGSSAGNIIILGQSTTLTATVSGSSDLSVNWPAADQPCQYTTTTVSGTTSTTSKPVQCPSDGTFGTLTNIQTTGTATYTAPNTIPDQTKFPSLQLIFTAQSQANTSKTGTLTLTLNSGVSVVLNPFTATVPTNEPQQFNVTLTNDLQSKGVTWLLTQQVPTQTIPFPQLKTCSPTCGTITPTANNSTVAKYTAPASVPTSITPADSTNKNSPANLTIVATSVADNTRLAIGTITIIAGGPITFNGITPTIAPQGAAFWDIYLDAPNISSAAIVTLTDSNNGTKLLNSSSGQLKVLFPIPTSTTTNPTSTGMRVRLFPVDLAKAGAFTVSVSDPGQPVTQSSTGTFSYSVIPVRPTVTASIPDDFPQGTLTNEARVTIDGGYFGPNGQLAQVLFQGNTIPQDPQIPSSSRQLNTAFPSGGINSGGPGLYPLSVAGTGTPPSPPLPNNPAVTNLAVFPDYATNPPVLKGAPVAAGTKPSAVDIDPTL